MSCLRHSVSTCFLVPAFFLGATGYGQVVAINAGNVIDPVSGEVKRDQIILVQDGKIKEIGRSVNIPENAARIDLSKETVLQAWSMRTRIC